MGQSAELYDPINALTTDWRTFFVDNRHNRFIFPCVEGGIEMSGAMMLLNIMMTMPMIKRHRHHAISSEKHLMLSGIYDASSHAKYVNEVSKTLESMGYTKEELGHDIIMTANDALNMCYTHLGSFIRTVDIFAIADTVLQDGVKEACTMDYGGITDGDTKKMEVVFSSQCKKVEEVLTRDDLPHNVFRAPLLCGSFKKKQFFQFILSIGTRSDTDDHLFLKPIVPSFLAGMQDIQDLALESRSASKSTFFNKTQMSIAQYNNRKIHIQNSTIWHLYPGDCGSTVYVTYEPTKDTVKFFSGKYFVNDHGTLEELTEDKFNLVVNKEIQFRDVPGCAYVDGYCEVCGGTLTKSFSRHGNVGYLANVNTGAPMAQQVLPTKHHISTDTLGYEVPHELEDFLLADANDIFLRPSIRKKTNILAFGFQLRDISKINDLKYYMDENELQASYYSEIKYMYIGMLKDDGTIEQLSTRTAMGGETKTYPHLSPEVLTVIRKHEDDIVIQDGTAWLLLRNINPSTPVMQCTVINKSIKRFVGRFTSLVTSDAERYTSINDFMRALTSLVWRDGSTKLNTHVTHISCLARACMITSRKDFHVPRITDPDDVMFGTLGRIIPMRSIGGLFSFERYNLVTNKPISFITPKRHGIADEFMGYQDLVERDMEYPIKTDAPVEYCDDD